MRKGSLVRYQIHAEVHRFEAWAPDFGPLNSFFMSGGAQVWALVWYMVSKEFMKFQIPGPTSGRLLNWFYGWSSLNFGTTKSAIQRLFEIWVIERLLFAWPGKEALFFRLGTNALCLGSQAVSFVF